MQWPSKLTTTFKVPHKSQISLLSNISVSRVEIQSSPSVAAAAIAVGAAVVLLLTALAVVTGEFQV